ncbi:NACHT domain-containing protein [Streptomyces sp. NBC_01016]|uniref:NACHT domain-containing protein n=1 Tax=Streptomyces sp. NBC_01016 TaxID=2903720 RepID=UPI002252840D|nr:NACHT domain-containing protein [Streptomyces sp. NBC_01016]MCX4827713.1 NACHT domain-containing protein [Streptomyces sp. NBC_01016]
MDPAALGTRLASSVIAPALKKLLVQEGPGAGLTDKPVRISGLVSFRGEKRTLTEADLERLARKLVDAAVAGPGEPPFPYEEQEPVVLALTRTLHALGDLTMDDVQAVRLGPRALAHALRRAAPTPELSADATYFLDALTEWSCVHILHFFTQRSTFVARTLVEQSRGQAEALAKMDALLARDDGPGRDRAFEERYRSYLAIRHNHLTIFGLDARDTADSWPLDVAYLSLEATRDAAPEPGEGPGATAPVTVRLAAEDALTGPGHERVLLRGDAGSGKTTLIQWLALTSEERIPYVLPLRTLIRAARLPAPADFLAGTDCPHSPPDGWAERVLSDGRALVMVDGLDEVPSADRARVRDWLLALVRGYPGDRWLLTARPTAVRPDWLAGDGFTELVLAPMDRPRVTAFVRRWHAAAHAPEHEEPLLDTLRTKPDLARLATNPLMCGLICALHRARRGYLPPRRKALYDAALQMILTERDRQRGMGGLDGIDLETEDQVELLQRLAYSLVLAGRTEMDEDTALTLLERALPSVPAASAQGDATTILRHLLLRSGVLRSPAPGIVDFAHRTFLDHLGARYAVEEGHFDVLLGHAEDTQWEDVLRMAVAHARTRERGRLLRGLLAADVPRLTLLALACLQDASSVDQEVVEEVRARAAGLIPPRDKFEAEQLAEAGPFVLELLPGPEGLKNAEAYAVVVTASLLGGEGALPALKKFRTHAALNVRRQLVGTWHRFDPQEYADEVLAHLDRDGLDLTVQRREEWAAARHLRGWSSLDLRGPYTLAEIFAGTELNELARLSLRYNPLVEDLVPLAELPSLRGLLLDDCPEVRDLAPLSGLALEHLMVFDLSTVRGLRDLTRLPSLSVNLPLSGPTLANSLPTSERLDSLYLAKGAITYTGLRGLDAMPCLRHLTLGTGAGPWAPADWHCLREHPSLSSLYLITGELPPGPLPELPRIDRLGLRLPHGPAQFANHAPLFPAVRNVTIYPGPTAVQDHAPYAALFPHAEVIVRPY